MTRPTFNLNSFLEKEKLKSNGSNFADWHRNPRILLGAREKEYVLNTPLGDDPAATAPEDERNVFLTRKNEHEVVQDRILFGLESELQKRFENYGPYELVEELKHMFQTHARVERYEATEK